MEGEQRRKVEEQRHVLDPVLASVGHKVFNSPFQITPIPKATKEINSIQKKQYASFPSNDDNSLSSVHDQQLNQQPMWPPSTSTAEIASQVSRKSERQTSTYALQLVPIIPLASSNHSALIPTVTSQCSKVQDSYLPLVTRTEHSGIINPLVHTVQMGSFPKPNSTSNARLEDKSILNGEGNVTDSINEDGPVNKGTNSKRNIRQPKHYKDYIMG